MARSKSSKQWLHEHFADRYVKQARDRGYRSRASFKLLELHQRDQLFRPGMVVLDLGAAPGGWSQVAAELVGPGGQVIASDILPMDALPGVEFVQGDFSEDAVFEHLLELVGGASVDLVISDMAPNLSGMKAVDQPRVMLLVELALDMARRVLREQGSFLAKVFQGEGFDELVAAIREDFDQVVIRKPQSSRSRSAEMYVLARGFSGRQRAV